MNQNRLTGSYYTSKRIARYIAEWAIRQAEDILLEPSFGDGVFIQEAANRFGYLGNLNPRIIGVELQKSVYSEYIENAPVSIQGFCQDYIELCANIKVNAVIGNPPYIRLRNLDKEKQKKIMEYVATKKVKMQSSGSLWMPFIIKSTDFLLSGGRMAFVLPYELTHVKYAYSLWNFLSKNFGDITLIRLHEDFFPEVDVETIILLLDNFGESTEDVNFVAYQDIESLFKGVAMIDSYIKIVDIIEGKKPFIFALLNRDQKNTIYELREKNFISPLINSCKFKIGYVCADKDFFHPDIDTRREYNLPSQSLLPCISNAKKINKNKEIGAIVKSDNSCDMLFLPTRPTQYDEKYIEYGEKNGVNLRYKCQNRFPWYITPSIEIPDIILTVFGEIPKLLINEGGYAVSNSLLAGYIRDDTTAEQLICRWYNSLTLLSIELNIHSLGGGVLVLIPGETDLLETINDVPLAKAKNICKEIDKCIKEQGLQAAYDLGDQIILQKIIGFSDEQINNIKSAARTLQYWRNAGEKRKR